MKMHHAQILGLPLKFCHDEDGNNKVLGTVWCRSSAGGQQGPGAAVSAELYGSTVVQG